MGALGNFLWFVLAGGLLTSIFWCLAGCLMYATVIGIPWGRACFTMARLTALPFGREAVPVEIREGRYTEGGGAGRGLGNALWFLLGGWYLALMHAFSGLFACVTVIGIPFGLQHFKLGGLALAPIGKRIVTKEEAQILRTETARARVERAQVLARA